MNILWPGAFLLLLPMAVFCCLRPFRSRRVGALRMGLYLLLVLAMAGLSIAWPDRAGTLVVAVDRSRSMPANAKEEAESLLRRLESSRPPDSQLGVIAFGAEPVIEQLPGSPGFDGLRSRVENLDGSDISQALGLALHLIPANSPGRILLFTDGLRTGADPARIAAYSAARGIPIDVRMLTRDGGNDLAIVRLDSPLKAAVGEFFSVNCRIVSPVAQRVNCRIRRGNAPWSGREVDLQRGVNFVSWRDRGDQPGVIDYTVEVAGADPAMDERPENNRARRLVEIAGRKPLLLLTESPSGNLGRVLARAGIPVVSRRPSPQELTPEKLAGCSGVILENVPAARLGIDGMTLLANLVKSGAIGLMMTGGRNSFAVGGYYRSPLEEILPISMEQRQEMRKNTLAIVVALDRSGSMASPIGKLTKMDMANLATLEVFKLLMPRDEFSVIAVDSLAHVSIPLTPVEEIIGGETRIRSIESMGGGIYVYTALHAAVSELMKSNAAARHLLLFADAADAEEPGSYRELLERATQAGITVSVVGLGFESDHDAEFLKDVAQRGNGMVYFSDRADELPSIFAQDTFLMARSTFLDMPVEALYTNALRSLSSADFGRSAQFGGYNLCYGKAGSEIILVSNDEFQAPIAATGHAGLGRVSVLTAEADGEYTGQFAADPMAGTLLAALAGWMMPPPSGEEGFLLTQTLADGVHRVEIHLDPERERDPFPAPPVAHTVVSRPDSAPVSRQDEFVWVSPDRLEANIPLDGEAVCLTTVGWEGKRPETLAPVALEYSPEFRPADPAAGEEIVEMAASTGGGERLLPDGVWGELPARPRTFPLTPWLLLLATLLLLFEVAERRIGLFLLFHRRKESDSAPPERQEKRAKDRRNPTSHTAKILSSEEKTTIQGEAPPELDSLSRALRRVRRR